MATIHYKSHCKPRPRLRWRWLSNGKIQSGYTYYEVYRNERGNKIGRQTPVTWIPGEHDHFKLAHNAFLEAVAALGEEPGK